MNAFGWLLRREYWEHRGGFFWAQVWTAGIMLLIIACLLVIGGVFASHLQGTITFGVPLDTLTQNMTPEQLSEVGAGLDFSLLMIGIFGQIVLFFAVFFYLLGGLYDDRKDRSVLFWKSLPISDVGTVASKVFTAAITAPVIAFFVTVVLQIGYLVMLSIFMLLHGINPIKLIWLAVSPFNIWMKMLMLLPIGALWALPTYGWLLLCSSFARSRPILWAILPLTLLGSAITFSDLLRSFALPSSWYWQNVFMRLLLSIVPYGSFSNLNNGSMAHIGQGGNVPAPLSWGTIFSTLATPDLWIGAVAGVAMLAGAVYFRRRRIESLN